MRNQRCADLDLKAQQQEGEQQTSEQASVESNARGSWEDAGWDEFFDSLNKSTEEEDEQKEA